MEVGVFSAVLAAPPFAILAVGLTCSSLITGLTCLADSTIGLTCLAGSTSTAGFLLFASEPTTASLSIILILVVSVPSLVAVGLIRLSGSTFKTLSPIVKFLSFSKSSTEMKTHLKQSYFMSFIH